MENCASGSLKFLQHYIYRYAHPGQKIKENPSENLELIVVIPSYKEPDLRDTLSSLSECPLPSTGIEVIVVINYPEDEDELIKHQSKADYQNLPSWANKLSPGLTFHFILANDLPQKFAGPGLARKIGMDEAIRRFAQVGNPNGIIANLDADTKVKRNYFKEILNHWERYPQTNGVSIHFEHPLVGNLNQQVYDGIIDYELHLRYYINAQIYSCFPYAYQTVGSSFAVSAEAYCKQGGMNKRKAGEDFYFIQKIIPLGKYYNLNTTTTFPSSRPSDRVPFGTGRTISDYLKNNAVPIKTYHFQSFEDLKQFLGKWEKLFHISESGAANFLKELPESIRTFLKINNFPIHLSQIKNKTTTSDTFRKAFFRWFNAFTLMKYLHFSRDHFYPNFEIQRALGLYFSAIGRSGKAPSTKEEMLIVMRKWDKELFQVK